MHSLLDVLPAATLLDAHRWLEPLPGNASGRDSRRCSRTCFRRAPRPPSQRSGRHPYIGNGPVNRVRQRSGGRAALPLPHGPAGPNGAARPCQPSRPLILTHPYSCRPVPARGVTAPLRPRLVTPACQCPLSTPEGRRVRDGHTNHHPDECPQWRDMATSHTTPKPRRRPRGDRALNGSPTTPDSKPTTTGSQQPRPSGHPNARGTLQMAAYVRQVVDAIPPLTEEQRARLALLIRGSRPSEVQADRAPDPDDHLYQREAA
jgi:hypothetical protein